MYNTILVTHAGTSADDEALNHAIFAARGTSAKIIILHVVEEIHYPPSFALSSSEREKLLNTIDEANLSIQAEMKTEIEKKTLLCKSNNIESKIKVVIGDASQIILDTIQNENVDLVIMAKRRKLKGIKRLLSLGSVSRKIIENSSCPILLIDAEMR